MSSGFPRPQAPCPGMSHSGWMRTPCALQHSAEQDVGDAVRKVVDKRPCSPAEGDDIAQLLSGVGGRGLADVGSGGRVVVRVAALLAQRREFLRARGKGLRVDQVPVCAAAKDDTRSVTRVTTERGCRIQAHG